MPKEQRNWSFLIQAIVQVMVVLVYFLAEVFKSQVATVLKPSWQLAIGVSLSLLVI